VDGHGRSAWLFLPVDSDGLSEALVVSGRWR
jgi:hypothetical protein